MAFTARNVCEEACAEFGITPDSLGSEPENVTLVLGKFNRLVDNWNAIRQAIYAEEFPTFALVGNLNPHTIGPTGATWTVSARPVSIEQMNLLIGTGTTQISSNIAIHNSAWWMGLTTPNITTTWPTDAYYDPTYTPNLPNGSIYFWPVPQSVYSVQLRIRAILGAYTLTTTVAMPPGYRDAFTLTLAEESAGLFGRTPSAILREKALLARVRIFGNNAPALPLRTQDAGMPQTGLGTRSNWNYTTGRLTP